MKRSHRIAVRVITRSSRDEIVGINPTTGILTVRVKAAPVNNAANEAIIALIAKAFKVRKRDCRIVIRAKSRDKTIVIDTDVSLQTLLRRL